MEKYFLKTSGKNKKMKKFFCRFGTNTITPTYRAKSKNLASFFNLTRKITTVNVVT